LSRKSSREAASNLVGGSLPQLYDDAGYSGGTMERPALKRLLADIAAHRIDAVVVYKVDRLTRSLSDFAKIVECSTRMAFRSSQSHKPSIRRPAWGG
jgi:DNA invertase Pin-like site-specific DNA recombinase